jgi:hypothetical protein
VGACAVNIGGNAESATSPFLRSKPAYTFIHLGLRKTKSPALYCQKGHYWLMSDQKKLPILRGKKKNRTLRFINKVMWQKNDSSVQTSQILPIFGKC